MLQHPKIAQERDDSVTSRQCVNVSIQNSVSFVSDDWVRLRDVESMSYYAFLSKNDLQDLWRRPSSAVSVCSSGLA